MTRADDCIVSNPILAAAPRCIVTLTVVAVFFIGNTLRRPRRPLTLKGPRLETPVSPAGAQKGVCYSAWRMREAAPAWRIESLTTTQTPCEEAALMPNVLRVTGNGKANRAI